MLGKKQTTAPKRASDKPRRRLRLPRFVRAMGSYFRGAYTELKQVRWPNRRTTWSLVLAVILYSAFFLLLVIGLDAGFNYLFKEVIL